MVMFNPGANAPPTLNPLAAALAQGAMPTAGQDPGSMGQPGMGSGQLLANEQGAQFNPTGRGMDFGGGQQGGGEQPIPTAPPAPPSDRFAAPVSSPMQPNGGTFMGQSGGYGQPYQRPFGFGGMR